MPSLWQWLCCSRRRFAAGRQERRRQKALAERQSAYMVRPTPDDPPALTDTSSGHAQPSQGGGVDANGNSVMQKLLEAENNRNRKRRRVDEIFHHQGRRESAPGGDLFRLRDRVFKSDRSLSENDTMYGYVPRAMQGMFISTALEGHKVEDYLPDHDIGRFSSLPSAYSSDNTHLLPLPSNGDDRANGNHGDPYHDNNGRRHSDAKRTSSGDVEDDVFPGEQRHLNVSHDVNPASSARFLRSTVTNLDDIDVVMETNGDDVSGNMAADAADDVSNMADGETEFPRDGAGREGDADWMWNTGKELEEPKGLTVDNDIENIFSCDGEVLY